MVDEDEAFLDELLDLGPGEINDPLGEVHIQSHSRIGDTHDQCEVLGLSHLGSVQAL